MLKNRIVYLTVLVILCLFRIAYTGYVAGMLLVIALILPIFSWLISLPGAIFTQVYLAVPDQVIRGQEATVTLSVRQSRLFATGNVRGKLRTTSVVTSQTKKVKLKSVYDGFPLDTSHCCQYRCTLRGLRITDLTGLLPMPTRRVSPVYVTVVPFPEEPPEHPDWSSSSALVAKPFSDASNPYDLREYRAGDTLRSIHWKKSAALDKTVNVVREKLVATDGATNYMREYIDAMDDATFDVWMKYHFSICERMDLIGATNHALDILEKINK